MCALNRNIVTNLLDILLSVWIILLQIDLNRLSLSTEYKKKHHAQLTNGCSYGVLYCELVLLSTCPYCKNSKKLTAVKVKPIEDLESTRAIGNLA